ncbi:MAG: four helix bundle protein [Planctomycetota bacterium]
MSNLTNLRVYQTARQPCTAAYRLAATIPGDPSLRDQIRRAATSVVSNIAEGRGRSTDADFARFLDIARGSVTELVAQLQIAADLGLIDAQQVGVVSDDLDRVGRQITCLIRRLRAG